MSCIVYRTDSAGRKYAYSSESYWDKEKGQPRSKRTYLGRVNPETGEIIKGRQNGRNYKPAAKTTTEASTSNSAPLPPKHELSRDTADTAALLEENKRLKEELRRLTKACQDIAQIATEVV